MTHAISVTVSCACFSDFKQQFREKKWKAKQKSNVAIIKIIIIINKRPVSVSCVALSVVHIVNDPTGKIWISIQNLLLFTDFWFGGAVSFIITCQNWLYCIGCDVTRGSEVTSPMVQLALNGTALIRFDWMRFGGLMSKRAVLPYKAEKKRLGATFGYVWND